MARHAGAASSAANAARELGLALGVAVYGTLGRPSTNATVPFALMACAVVGIVSGAVAAGRLRR